MSRTSKIAGAAAVTAAGPSGLRRLFGGCLVMVLLGGLALTALLAFVAWRGGDEQAPTALPCPPAHVTVRDTTASPEARQAVTQALRDAGRLPRPATRGDTPDLVVQSATGEGRLGRVSDPTKVALGVDPTPAEVTRLLAPVLGPCGAAERPAAAAAPADPAAPAAGPQRLSWGPAAWIGAGLAVWWLAGPNLARGALRAAWPLRLAWRRWQRWAYRRAVRVRGRWPEAWPEQVSPGQRWHEAPDAMTDRRTPRQQAAEGEPERRAALAAEIRANRTGAPGLRGRAWQAVYRQPTPTETGVSS